MRTLPQTVSQKSSSLIFTVLPQSKSGECNFVVSCRNTGYKPEGCLFIYICMHEKMHLSEFTRFCFSFALLRTLISSVSVINIK